MINLRSTCFCLNRLKVSKLQNWDFHFIHRLFLIFPIKLFPCFYFKSIGLCFCIVCTSSNIKYWDIKDKNEVKIKKPFDSMLLWFKTHDLGVLGRPLFILPFDWLAVFWPWWGWDLWVATVGPGTGSCKILNCTCWGCGCSWKAEGSWTLCWGWLCPGLVWVEPRWDPTTLWGCRLLPSLLGLGIGVFWAGKILLWRVARCILERCDTDHWIWHIGCWSCGINW